MDRSAVDSFGLPAWQGKVGDPISSSAWVSAPAEPYEYRRDYLIEKHLKVLGTEYTIYFLTEKEWKSHPDIEKDTRKNTGCKGVCYGYQHKIFIRKNLESAFQNGILRHEIIHAFQYEAGIDYAWSQGWTQEDETDWLSFQVSKIAEVFKELNI